MRVVLSRWLARVRPRAPGQDVSGPGAGRGTGQAELPAFALVPRRVNSSLNFGPPLRSPVAADFTFVS